ncbi:MAG: response regulator transcription factor [Cyanobacteria bacterium SZAS LIN-5]|nr:response regulator transcription factor [Cyanobacteria bacterium SZAS LIN-5]
MKGRSIDLFSTFRNLSRKIMSKILIVEDDEALADSIKDILEFDHHHVDAVADGALGLEHALSGAFDLIILDRQLPGMQGTDICTAFRNKGGQTPILMLTALSSVDQKVEGFESGVDDYLTKPFAMPELLVRIKALLKRPPIQSRALLSAGNISLDAESKTVMQSGQNLKLKPLEFSVLEYFMTHPNKVISAEELLKRVWKTEADASVDSVYTSINRLRKKLGENADQILQTVHGLGYKLVK